MQEKVFIQSNKKQALGALLAKFAIERHTPSLPVEILMVEDVPALQQFRGKTYLRKGREIPYDHEDLQSFTLTRFMPPELMNYAGKALVIDPDIFAISSVEELFSIPMGDNAILACAKKEAWDSSLMVLNCSKLSHWKISSIVDDLAAKVTDYDTWMTLKEEKSVGELSRIWNSLDTLTADTKILHTTNRLTQPWKTGLPRDFTINPLPKYFGLIPREPLYKLLGKYPTHYQPNPDKQIELFFLDLLKEAMDKGAVSKNFLEEEVAKKHVRPDIFPLLKTLT